MAPPETASSTSPSPSSSPNIHPDSPPSEGTDDLDPAPHHPRRRTAPRPAPGDHPPEAREKRKRSRVTPDQLTQLEAFFAANRSPTAARRKEISDILGMTERQTQIWFQNRRAKAKLQAGNKQPRPSTAPSPDMAPMLTLADDPHVRARIHEDGPVTLLPCTDLAIGTWRRIATPHAKYDLLAYVCEARRALAWYVYCAGAGFKMEIPFDTIADATIDPVSPGIAIVRLTLARPPAFFLESRASLGADGAAARYWRPCSDWTEDMQASQVLRHDLVGAAPQLSRDLIERCQLGRHAIPAQPFAYADEPAPGSRVHAPAPVAGHSGMYHPPRMDYPAMLSRRASEASLPTHSPAPWDSPPNPPYLPVQQGASGWPENYSLTAASKPIVPYNVQPADPMRLAASPPAPVPPYMGGYYAQRDSEASSYLSSTGTPFDLPSPPTADLSQWGDPPIVPYDTPGGYDQQLHMRTHEDMPPFGFDPAGSMPDHRYG